MSSGAKSCIRCGGRLARDNTGEQCGPCERGRERLPRLERPNGGPRPLGWLYQDAGDLAMASEWTGRAATLAGECGDERLRSYTLVRQSNIAVESGNPAIAIELARAALRNSAELPRVRTLALLQLAHGHALRREGNESDRAIGQAWEATADTAAGDVI
ncbi:hypothetical protein [Nocardia sp. CA-145437]|uniref:hypothetical protein n=1 Tax=Nocardia sp. CA-145437 TaxID=3239980 RepID=UPI003D9867C2